MSQSDDSPDVAFLHGRIKQLRVENEQLKTDVARMSQEQNALQSILDETLAENITLRRDADNGMGMAKLQALGQEFDADNQPVDTNKVIETPPADDGPENLVKPGFDIEPQK